MVLRRWFERVIARLAWDDSPGHAPTSGDKVVREQTWAPLRVLNLYRLAVSGSLTAIESLGLSRLVLGFDTTFELFALSVCYLILAVVYIFTITNTWPGYRVQVAIQVGVDLLVVTALLYLAGGIGSGLGVLLVVSVAGGSLLLSGSGAALFAAVASLSLVSVEYRLLLEGSSDVARVSKAGILGLVFFATAAIAHLLARKASEQRRLAEERGLDLANMNEVNRAVIEHLDSGVVVVDSDLRVRTMNRRAAEMCRVVHASDKLNLDAASPRLAELLSAWQARGETALQAFRIGGSSQLVLPRVVPLGVQSDASSRSRTRAGQLARRQASGYLVLLDDADRLADESQRARLTALGRLSASIAHEIRNPLGAISHAAQLLELADDEDRPRLQEIIRSNCDRVSDVIQNVLDLYRNASGTPTAVEFPNWLADCVDNACAETGVCPRRVSVETPARLMIDELAVAQVLTVLISNAVRHGASRGAEDESSSWWFDVDAVVSGERLFIHVIDNGPGVSPDDVASLFEPFFSTHPGGSGLGLYIASQLAIAMNGSLRYLPPDSGVGADFCLTIPLLFPDDSQQGEGVDEAGTEPE